MQRWRLLTRREQDQQLNAISVEEAHEMGAVLALRGPDALRPWSMKEHVGTHSG